MVNSIQQFCSEGVKNLEKVMVDYASDMTKIAEMVHGVTKAVTDLGLSMIAEEWEGYDELLRKRKNLRPEWYIVRRDETTLLTSLGSVTYHKTLFKNKHTGEHAYLLDRVMGIEKHARLTEDAEAKILEEAVQTSYRRGGENAALTGDVVSKETVMNKIHSLKFPRVEPQPEKRAHRYLYIDADEDHVSLQYIDKKGDIRKPRTNTVMPKLIYVYEGITNENGRNELIRKKHFGGVYEGTEEIAGLWGEVAEYIEASYDTEAIKKIYINGDGAAWIKSGQKYVECSAEGHISHVFADRMSSRPLGWSRTGADRMSRLRIYERNGGSMLALVRYQKEALPKASGCGKVIYSSHEMFMMERKNRKALGALAGLQVYSIPYPQITKIASLKNHIWGL